MRRPIPGPSRILVLLKTANGDDGVNDGGVAVSRSYTFSLLSSFAGSHSKAVTRIALPSGGDKIFTGSTEGTVCVWDKNNNCSHSNGGEHRPAQVNESGGPSLLIAEGVSAFAGACGHGVWVSALLVQLPVLRSLDGTIKVWTLDDKK